MHEYWKAQLASLEADHKTREQLGLSAGPVSNKEDYESKRLRLHERIQFFEQTREDDEKSFHQEQELIRNIPYDVLERGLERWRTKDWLVGVIALCPQASQIPRFNQGLLPSSSSIQETQATDTMEVHFEI